MHQEELKGIAAGNSENEDHDELFQPTKTVQLDCQHYEYDHRRQQRGHKQRDSQ
jgi:hypothetical protein